MRVTLLRVRRFKTYFNLDSRSKGADPGESRVCAKIGRWGHIRHSSLVT